MFKKITKNNSKKLVMITKKGKNILEFEILISHQFSQARDTQITGISKYVG